MDWEQRERSSDGTERKECRLTGNREEGVEMNWI
jgi:hypothetical protein